MAATKTERKRELIRKWAIQNGWNLDRYGNYRNGEYRLKFGKKALRYERQVQLSHGKEWRRIKSGYYSSITISPTNGLQGMTY